MIENENEDVNRINIIRKLISGSVDIAGGAIGGALGFLAGGPVGAALLGAGGTAVSSILKRLGEETAERLLSTREKIRIGGALALAASEINQRLNDGESIRDDGFFDKNSKGRSDADEVVENVLLKSQREPEESKIPYMGHLLSNISFDKEINASLAHQIIKSAEQLTYRQLCILKLIAIKENYNLRITDYRDQGTFTKDLYQVLYECLDLYHRGFINIGGEVVFGPTDIAPGKMTVQGLGADLYNLMSLVKIQNDELISLVQILS